MTLLTDRQRERMLANGCAREADLLTGDETTDFVPVVKLFCPWGAATWLLSELDPENPDIAFGLCDLGVGCPELGNVSLSELESIRSPGGLGVERDLHFYADKTLFAYADEAKRLGHINVRGR
ncbi:DUF2958 domain-containing protein [Bradyrhizobium brasilense]|uniref:DUF2958 domain-containing protein n=1 Tax=Bradyrhizobium brasilense TaxID=1419277 RepID=UPI0024B109EA|nr:DUF2958 domain-containing protein [Bradyrhizobium australafricanum]WFU33661.1 DUF2958 domain-containing protein [Bradyrhizobium australafricanum]